jgi:alpha-galactosidase
MPLRLPFVLFPLIGLATANRNSVGQLPIMGWSGYNAFMQNSGHCATAGAAGYNETTFLTTADALIKTGLRELGYTYLNLDDCWIAENRTASGELTWDKTRFSRGMPWLAEQAHTRHLKLGLYAAASIWTCRDYPGSQGFEERDAKTFANWGADFVKLDSCSRTFLANGTESWFNQYTRWSKAMNATGRQMVFSCSWAVYWTSCAVKHPPTEWETQCGTVPWERDVISDSCHLWRYGEDLHPRWGDGAKAPMTQRVLSGTGGGGIGDIIEFASSIFAYNWREVTGPGAFNDPDFLVVGCPTDRPCDHTITAIQGTQRTARQESGGDDHSLLAPPPSPPTTDIEQRTQFSMWCILGAPLIIGSDVRALSPTALATLSNEKAIAINQDALAARPRLLEKSNDPQNAHQIWARPLQNGDFAVALINTGDRSVDITLRLHDIVCANCRPKATLVDVWASDENTLGSSGPPTAVEAEGTYTAKGVRSHETVLLRATPSGLACNGEIGRD